jgi:plasmid stabilization system protein ParE
MPSAWSRKDERKFEHIKEGYRERGASEDRAEEIAGRTVNRDRREEGRTPQRSTQGTGDPNTPLESRSVNELRNIASDLDIHGRSRLRKSELIDAIRAERGQG